MSRFRNLEFQDPKLNFIMFFCWISIFKIEIQDAKSTFKMSIFIFNTQRIELFQTWISRLNIEFQDFNVECQASRTNFKIHCWILRFLTWIARFNVEVQVLMSKFKMSRLTFKTQRWISWFQCWMSRFNQNSKCQDWVWKLNV